MLFFNVEVYIIISGFNMFVVNEVVIRGDKFRIIYLNLSFDNKYI